MKEIRRGKEQTGDGKGERTGKLQDFRQFRLVFFGGGNADKWLDSLRNARENRDGDKRDIGDDSVSRDTGIACKREYGAVEKDMTTPEESSVTKEKIPMEKQVTMTRGEIRHFISRKVFDFLRKCRERINMLMIGADAVAAAAPNMPSPSGKMKR